MLNTDGNFSPKDTLRLKYEGKINNTYIPHMKVILNYKGTTLCIPVMIGGHCDFADPCWYYLQVNVTDRLPGTSNAKYKPFHNWLEANKEHIRLIIADSHNDNLAPSSSS